MGISGFMMAAAQQRRPRIPAEPPPQPNPRPVRNQAGHRHNPHDQFVPDVDEPQSDDQRVPNSR